LSALKKLYEEGAVPETQYEQAKIKPAFPTEGPFWVGDGPKTGKRSGGLGFRGEKPETGAPEKRGFKGPP